MKSITISSGLALLAVSGFAQIMETKKQPNIIFILADDQRFDELGCTGHPIVKTPNLDRLAKEGARFTNSFVTSASSMPSRTSLLTGQWERRHTIGWNSGSALSQNQWNQTLPMLLRQNGYVTAYVGKNHTPGLRSWDFDYYYASYLGHLNFYPKEKHSIFKNAGANTQPEILREGAINFMATDSQFVERAGDKAGLFLHERPKDKPFFLYLCFNVPHGVGTGSMKQLPTDDGLYRTAYRNVKSQMPLPPGYLAEADVITPKLPYTVYSGKQIGQYNYRRTPEALREQYVRICQTVTGIDQVVGQILEQLERLGQADNTIIVYSSDNGILHGEHGYGGKMLLYEPSIRVPLIIYDPRIPSKQRGQSMDELVVLQDVAPTLLDLCGLSNPSVMQGRSLLPLLHGKKTGWRRDFFCEGLALLQEYPLMQGVRSEEWKYIRYWANRETPPDYREILNLGLQGEVPCYEELFHLTSDSLEQKNLASDPKYKAQLDKMRTRCTELLRETRGNPKDLPGIPIAEWTKEMPDVWKELLQIPSGEKGE